MAPEVRVPPGIGAYNWLTTVFRIDLLYHHASSVVRFSASLVRKSSQEAKDSVTAATAAIRKRISVYFFIAVQI
jgi:hypothetical protein